MSPAAILFVGASAPYAVFLRRNKLDCNNVNRLLSPTLSSLRIEEVGLLSSGNQLFVHTPDAVPGETRVFERCSFR